MADARHERISPPLGGPEAEFATESHRPAAAPRGSDRSAGPALMGGRARRYFLAQGKTPRRLDLIEKGLMEEGAGLDFDEDFEGEFAI